MTDLEDLVKTKNCGPILIRLSWHDAGVFSKGKLQGGCPNAAMRFTDGGEGAFGANAGLPDVALGLLKPITVPRQILSGVSATSKALNSLDSPVFQGFEAFLAWFWMDFQRF